MTEIEAVSLAREVIDKYGADANKPSVKLAIALINGAHERDIIRAELKEAQLAVARMLPWQKLSDAQEHTIKVLAKKRDDYKSQLDELTEAVILGPLKGKTAHDEIVTLRAERLELRRSLFELIELCKLDSVGLADDQRVRDAKELIRCIVQGCGLGGACDGKGLPQYPCPLRIP